MGIIDFAPIGGSKQGLTESVLQWLAQIVLLVCSTQALGAKTNLLTCAVLSRTRQSCSEKEWMTSACTLIMSVIQFERLISVTSERSDRLPDEEKCTTC